MLRMIMSYCVGVCSHITCIKCTVDCVRKTQMHEKKDHLHDREEPVVAVDLRGEVSGKGERMAVVG